jgi:FtsZ-interacting cell division protein ZipA
VIVGKGNHSTDHIQKIKPRVEQVCRELGLQYYTEENEGRIYVNLQGAGHQPQGYDYEQHQQPHHENYGTPHYETAYPLGNKPNYAQAAGGGMQYQPQQQQQHRPQQQMGVQEPQPEKESKCCGLCVVM